MDARRTIKAVSLTALFSAYVYLALRTLLYAVFIYKILTL